MLQPDSIFDGQYKLLKLLGRGGFSEVWLAEEEFTHLQVALKIYAPGSGMDDDGIRTIGNEFKLLFTLNQPNLLLPRGFRAFENMPYLVLPYCAKGSALNLIGRMDEKQVWQFIAQVSSGLAYLHERDIIHQDIKPDNILIDDSGTFLITDFGISTKARSTLRKSVMMGNNAGGTTAYMGPERFSREPAPVKASDIWSLGATVFEMMTGELPFGELGGGLQKGGAEIPFIKGDYSDKLKNVVEQMLAPETWNRPLATTLTEWGIDHSKVQFKQIQVSTPQEPDRTGHATQMMPNVPTEPTPEVTPQAFETDGHTPRPQMQNDANKNSTQTKQQKTPSHSYGDGKKRNKTVSILFIIIMLIVGGFGITGYLKVKTYNRYINRFNNNLERATVQDAMEPDQLYVDYEGRLVNGPLADAQWCIEQINLLKNGFGGFLINNSPNDDFQSRYDARCAELKEVLYLSQTTITDDGKGGNFNVKVSTSVSWCNVKSDQNWCKVKEEDLIDRFKRDQNELKETYLIEGTRLSVTCSNLYYKINIEANPTTSTRTATVTFSTYYKTATISITQKPKPNGISATNTNSENLSSSTSATQNEPKTQAQTNSGGDSSTTNAATTNSSTATTSKISVPGYYSNIEMVYVEGGTFKMGATSEQGSDACEDEEPAHNVTLNSYYIGKYEVTQGLWFAVMGSNPSEYKKGDNYPVDNVSWNDCKDFIEKLNNITGKKFRLPTEAEWEFAARGGNKSAGNKYSGSNNFDNVSWHEGNSNKTTHPVGQKMANELGLFDMSGNVYEWCSDRYGDYHNYLQINPKGVSSGLARVLRGGSSGHEKTYCRVTSRSFGNPNSSYDNSGLRLVLDDSEGTSKMTIQDRYTIVDKKIYIGLSKIEMVYVEGGTFTMGGTSEQGTDVQNDERPTHKVTLDGYYIGKYEVTQALWKEIMGNNPSEFKGDNYPVDNVSWNDCQKFIKKLNEKMDEKFRLPTEAEWEFAARGGNKSQGFKYSGSNDIYDVAWHCYNSNSTHSVGRKRANELGIYDMSGNVSEWCQDWYGEYKEQSQHNPTGALNGEYRVMRGGHIWPSWKDCRVSARDHEGSDYYNVFTGLRLALDK